MHYLSPFPGSSPWHSQPPLIDNVSTLRRNTKGKSALRKLPEGAELPFFQKRK